MTETAELAPEAAEAPDVSPVQVTISTLVDAFGDDARAVLEGMLASLTTVELCTLAFAWRSFWARPKQLAPEGKWDSWGFCTGRAFGKTRAVAEYLQEEVREGRSKRLALIAQNEEETRKIMVDGVSGLLATSPPWFKATVEKGFVVWPNGAIAQVFTPEAPGNIRGNEFDNVWATEMVVWPPTTRDETWSNLRFACRLGYGRTSWDTTPKRKHPLIRKLLERHKKRPQRHRVTRGTMYENADNLTDGLLEDLEDEFGGTQGGDEELRGIFFDDDDDAAWKQKWIDDSRRFGLPEKLKRRVLSIDPAVSANKQSDRSGILDLGLASDGQALVIADLSAKYAWEQWGALVVERYFDVGADCIVVERNRGGDAPTANIRAAAKDPGLLKRLGLEAIEVVVVDKKAITRYVRGTIYVKEEKAHQRKEYRHQPIAGLYEKGRVSHVGEGMAVLESWMTTWVPVAGAKSPDAIDALVQGVYELTGITIEARDPKRATEGIAKLAAAVQSPTPSPERKRGISALLSRRTPRRF